MMEGRDHEVEEDKAAWAEAARTQGQDAGPASSALPRASAQLTTEEADIPMSAIRGGSKKKVLLIGVAALLLAGGGIAGFGYFQNQSARKQTQAAFGELSQCLVGEAVTSSAEIPMKYRAHQVAIMGRKPDERAEGGEPWPERCATPALKVVDAAEDAGLESSDGKSLYAAADELAKALKEKRGLDNDISGLLRNTWEQAEAAKLTPSASSVAGPPTHKPVMVLDQIPDTAIVSKEYVALNAMHTTRHPSEEGFIFFDRKEAPGPFYCRVEKERLLCKKVPADVAKLGHAITVNGSSDPGVPPLFFAGNRGDAGVYRGDTGALVDKMDTVGAYARKDGLVVLLGVADGKMTLAVQKKSGDLTTRYPLDEELKPFFEDTVEWGNGFYTTMVSHGYLYAQIWKEGQAWKLYAFPIGADGRPKKPTLIGDLSGSTENSGGPSLSSCRTADARRTVRIHHYEHDYVTFFADGTWTRPLEANGLSEGIMDCGEGRATFTQNGSLTLCTSAECTQEYLNMYRAPNNDLAPRSGANDRALVKDTLVAIWGAGQRGGIRGRRALPKEWESSTDAVLFDDLVADGKLGEVSTVTELKVLPAPGSALVLLQTRKGLVAMRVGSDGGFTPDNVVWE
ncbi:MAG: hypothetical protein HOW73_25685 [Polyangiaceae bacterium]|nr:hypothetical protein [Polyangiaceae bacterium]